MLTREFVTYFDHVVIILSEVKVLNKKEKKLLSTEMTLNGRKIWHTLNETSESTLIIRMSSYELQGVCYQHLGS